MKTSIILAVHDALSYTKQCIMAVRAFVPKGSYEILVVDNGSTDGTAAWLAREKDIKLLQNPANLGAAVAWNQAAAVAQGEELLFLHNDVVLPHGTLAILQAALWSQPEIGAVGPVTNRCQLVYQKIAVPEYHSFADLQDFADRRASEEHSAQQSLYLESFCLLMKREAFLKTGSFDGQFLPHYYEDFDYSLRLLQNGYRMLTVMGAFVHHEGGELGRTYVGMQKAVEANEARFQEKWGIRLGYSGNVRPELLLYLDLTKRPLSVLDVGCSCGANLMRIKEVNPEAEVYGIELDPYSAAIAGIFGEVTNANVETAEYPEWQGKFDYIIMGDVLEHLQDPWRAVRHMATCLKPGGGIVASVPNVEHLSVLQGLLQGDWPYAPSGILDRTHLRFFTQKTARELFEQAGLTLKETGYSRMVLNNLQAQKLRKELCSLESIHVEEENLNVFQWHIFAVRP